MTNWASSQFQQIHENIHQATQSVVPSSEYSAFVTEYRLRSSLLVYNVLLLLLRVNVIATLYSIDFKVAATAKSCVKVKVSHAAVKSFDRRGISCKNAQTVQFSGGVEKCPVTRITH